MKYLLLSAYSHVVTKLSYFICMREQNSNANTTITHLTTSQVNRRLLKDKLSSKIKLVFWLFFFPWLLLLIVWDWNTGLTFPISFPQEHSSSCGSFNSFFQHLVSPITHSEPSHPTPIVWGLIHQHHLLLWTSWFEKLHARSLEQCNPPTEDELIFCNKSF